MLKHISLFYAQYRVKKLSITIANAKFIQQNTLLKLTRKASKTIFGKDHNFSSIHSYQQFKQCVPIRRYEDLEPYIKKIKQNTPNVLWPGRPMYFCTTSGTTAGSKYIPLSKEGVRHQINGVKQALLCYIAQTKCIDFASGKMIFIQGSPHLDKTFPIPSGRLSGIAAHHVPFYLKNKRLPSFKTNCIEDWVEKIEGIVSETKHQNMTLISGIPPWIIDYFERLTQEKKSNSVTECFPNLSLLMYGGVNFKPYQDKINNLLGKRINSLEVYPASEGFIAYQHLQNNNGLLLNLDGSIFYEFIPIEQVTHANPTRLSLNEVNLDTQYAIVLNTNSGLWGYLIGDTVKFTSISPPLIVVTGRIAQYISAFGEHVIIEEIEQCVQQAEQSLNIHIKEYHVAPLISQNKDISSHYNWFVEFDTSSNINPYDFCKFVDLCLQNHNTYYKDLRKGQMLNAPKLTQLKPEVFNSVLKDQGRFGGQNKPPRAANDFKFAQALIDKQNVLTT